MNELVTVIMPVYNVEKYLTKSVNSILKQTYKNLEIILVDDGSPDNCPKMCDAFAKKDSRVRVIHKENGGVSSARNMGIEEATGKYIMFVDSDDWLPKNSIELLTEKTEKEQADFCTGGIVEVSVSRNSKKVATKKECIYTNNSEELVWLIENMFLAPWGKLYKFELLNKHNIRFPLGVAYSEDTFFLIKYLQVCEKLCSVNSPVYNYNEIALCSATRKYHSELYKWIFAWLEEMEALFSVNYDNKFATYLLGYKGLGGFDYICRHYIFHTDVIGGLEKVEATIKKAYISCFKKYINIFKENKDFKTNEQFLSLLNFYTEYVEKDDFASLCKELSKQMYQQKPNKIKRIFRNILIKIKTFILFRIFK